MDWMEISESLKESMIDYFAGTITKSQAGALIEWVEATEENRKAFIQFGEIYHTSFLSGKTEFDASEAWVKLERKLEERDIKPLRESALRIPISYLYKVASIALLLILAGTGAYFILKPPGVKNQIAWFELNSPKGSRSSITLSDGSKIWLNAGTKLKYNSEYGLNSRDLYLDGEGYFEVAKNKNIPFNVITSDIKVTATGTAFNVKAYKDEDVIETTLEEGSVQITSLHASSNKSEINAVALKPNQKALFNKKGGAISVNEKDAGQKENNSRLEVIKAPVMVKIVNVPDTRLFTSWKDSRWIFKNEKLGDLAPKLERRYDISIVFRDTCLKSYAFTGILVEESLEQVLQAIRLSAPIRYEINQKTLVLFEDKRWRNQVQNSIHMN